MNARVLPVIVAAAFFSSGVAHGQQQVDNSAAPQNAVRSTTQPSLATQQKSVASRFSELEDVLLRSSELVASENPTRASLLRQAVQISKQVKLADSLLSAASKLDSGQYSEAIALQKAGRANLQRILELLQSENREQRVREQRAEVRRWIEETDRLLRMQSSLRGRTEGGQDFKQAAENQQQLESKADQIRKDVSGDDKELDSGKKERAAQEEQTEPGADDEEGDDTSEDSGENLGADAQQSPGSDEDAESNRQPSSAEKTPSGQQNEDSSEKNRDRDEKNADNRDSSSQQQRSESQESSESSTGDRQSSEQDQQQPQSPTQRAKNKIADAQRKMQEAQKALEDANRDDAIEKQREAEEKLREAVAELEQILRQIREEEIERSLASLEVRLRRMLEMQAKVLNETRRISEISGEELNRQVEIAASKLALEEKKILTDGERAFMLLREEGSSAAFPEAMEQVNTDVASIAERLEKGNVGEMTVVIEEEVVSSLEEMIASLVAVQKDNEKKKQQQKQSGGNPASGQQGDQPLVDKLAELRLVRSLQTRINKRTQTLAKMLDESPESFQQDVLPEIGELAERQQRISRVARTLVEGR